MKRDSTTLFLLLSNNTILPVPWTGIENVVANIQSAYQSPTREVAIASWDAFVLSGNELEVIADPVPPNPLPNWDGFMADCDDVFAAGLQANYLVFTQIFNMLLALKAKGVLDESSVEWRNFTFNYQIGKASLTPEQIAQVESAMANNNIPVLS
jgi:hypothetical protein